MRNIIHTIAAAIILFLFVKCNDASPGKMKKKAIKITELLDSSTIKIFHEWNYGERDVYGLWTRLSGGSTYYTCWYYKDKDTAYLRIYKPFRFVSDFPSNYSFDTSRFRHFNFVEYGGRIIRVQSAGRKGSGDLFTDISQPVGQIFFKQNPFDKFDSLTSLKDSLGVHNISYQPDAGNFIQFWLSAQYQLTYLPDNLQMNPKSQKTWQEEFAKGEMIKKNWNLRKVY